MAGDWIKMRGALLDHPKVIAIARVLQQNKDFREWLTPGGGSDMNGQIVSPAASRAVTTALLLRAWSAAREHGKFDGDDLWLEHSWIEDIDQLAGAPGFGLAMEAVGWVKGHPVKKGVILPNFKEFNVPMTEAERAKTYRERKKQAVTEPSRTHRDEKHEIVTTRVEKSREEQPLRVVNDTAFGRFWQTWPSSQRKVARSKCAEVWKRRGLDAIADQIVAHVCAAKETDQWQRGYEPAPLTYLNQRRWEDGDTRPDQFAGAL